LRGGWVRADLCHVSGECAYQPTFDTPKDGWRQVGTIDIKAEQIDSLCTNVAGYEHEELALKSSPKPAKKCQKVPLFSDKCSSLVDDRARRQAIHLRMIINGSLDWNRAGF
jgi:hypothetical protein